jgi:hypothetical protein
VDILTKVTNIPAAPDISDVREALKGLDSQLSLLSTAYDRLNTQLVEGRVMTISEYERCSSEAVAAFSESQATAAAEVVTVIEEQVATTRNTLSEMMRRLRDIQASISESHDICEEVRVGLTKLETLGPSLEKIASLEKLVTSQHEELSDKVDQSRQPTALNIAQAVGTTATLAVELHNLVLAYRVKRNQEVLGMIGTGNNPMLRLNLDNSFDIDEYLFCSRR